MDISHFADSGWSVLPPLLAVALAIITRRVLLSLGVGIVAGSLLLNQFSPLDSLHYMFNTVLKIFWVDGALNRDNINRFLAPPAPLPSGRLSALRPVAAQKA